YTSAGVLDTAFDTDGKITTVFSGGSDEITSIAFDVGVNAGKILVAGTMFPGLVTGYDIGLARYNADGSLDDTFGTDGLVETDNFDFLGNRASDHGNALAVQSDGKILVAGSYQILGITNFFLARYAT
ncbi:hypothetical protein, partial [Chromatium okenii]|uniref:hypothetical protein n=1 Tax=Chromatium okenii TaxID=61644 RepID=UPI0026EE49C4